MAEPINELVNDLPQRNITTMALEALDFVVPGEWDNTVGWHNTIKVLTGASGNQLDRISGRALDLYGDEDNGYQSAIWLYRSTDNADTALGAAALADKVGGRIPLFGGLIDRLTPKADHIQALDLALKLTVEIVAYTKLHRRPANDIGSFVNALRQEYNGPSMIRAAALVCFDGLIPLGPDFLDVLSDRLNGMDSHHLASNGVFKTVGHMIPGGGVGDQLSFINQSVSSARGWMNSFVTSRGLSPQKVTSSLQKFIELSDSKLDYLAAFIDMSTNYFEHTGIQTVARHLILRAQREVS